MITFKQYISESLSSSYPLRRGGKSHEFYQIYFFDDGKRNYRITMADEYADTVEVIFSSEGDTHVLNNGSNALRVYSTVGRAIEDFIDRNEDIKWVKFSAADERTVPVYAKLAKRIALKYNGHVTNNTHTMEWSIKVR